MKEVDLGETSSFLDHDNLGCIQRDCKMSNEIVANCRDMCSSQGKTTNQSFRET